MSRFSTALAFVSLLLLGACGDSSGSSFSSNVNTFCNASCAKQAECGFLMGGITESQCRTECTNDAQMDTSCTIIQSNVDSCVDQLNNSTCAELTTGPPAVCNDICEEDADTSGGNDSSQADTTSGQPDTTSFDAVGAACAALANCCPTLSGAAKTTCEATVANADPNTCTSEFQTLVIAGECI